MKDETKKYLIQDKEAGNVLESNLTYAEAEITLTLFENQDKKQGIYTPEFYEITEEA